MNFLCISGSENFHRRLFQPSLLKLLNHDILGKILPLLLNFLDHSCIKNPTVGSANSDFKIDFFMEQ